jgi:small conductance mechanosensitive channel
MARFSEAVARPPRFFRAPIRRTQPRASLKVAGAIAIYIVSRWLIGLVSSLLTRAMERQKIEPTVIRYIANAIAVALNIMLVIGILGYFGVETTSFAALIAAPGLAIGAAWGGLLSNFAAGAFILVLRPFKVGDYVLTSVGNAAVMGGTIKNFSHNPYRRVELTAQLDHTVDPQDAIRRLKAALPAIANVVAAPAPDVEILAFNARGPVLAVRPYVNTAHYWQVFFDTNKVIRDTFGTAGYPVPESHLRVRQNAA